MRFFVCGNRIRAVDVRSIGVKDEHAELVALNASNRLHFRNARPEPAKFEVPCVITGGNVDEAARLNMLNAANAAFWGRKRSS